MRLLRIARRILALPTTMIVLAGDIGFALIGWMTDLAYVWEGIVGRLFRPVCRRHGHELALPRFGWQYCERCDYAVPFALRSEDHGA